MTAITASALVGMCGQLFAFNEEKPYLFFDRLGEADYVFLFNLSNRKLKSHLINTRLPNDSFLFFNFEVMDGDMAILKNIGQERMPNGYQQFFDVRSLVEGDVLGGFVVGHDSITDFIQEMQNL